MLKFIVNELLKSYGNNHKISGHDYFVGIFAIGAFVTLIVADFMYLQSDYKPIGMLLICSTILLAIALLIKIIYFCLKKKLYQHAPSHFLIEALPLITRILPVSVITFILWEITKAKFAHKFRNKLQKYTDD